MFGTVARCSVKPGKMQDFLKMMMDNSRTPKGMRAAYIYETGPDELFMVAVFDDETTYRANAADPQQDREFRKFRELLTADPEWHDGAVSARPGNNA